MKKVILMFVAVLSLFALPSIHAQSFPTVPTTGTTFAVNLSWSAPTNSSDPVAGYNVYRAANGASIYTLVNTAPVTTVTYSDTTVALNTSYQYYVESVDSSGNASGPSNTFTITIPNDPNGASNLTGTVTATTPK